MASNFDFLADSHRLLHKAAVEAEELALRSPRAACFHARFALESTVHWLYRHDPTLSLPYDHSLGALLHEQSFKDNLPRKLFHKVRTIHKVGNHAAHDPRPLGHKDALHVVRELFHVLHWVARMYAEPGVTVPELAFDAALVPRPEKAADLSREQVADLERRLAASDEMRRIHEERRQQTDADLKAALAELAALKAANAEKPDEHDYDEEETRDRFIDILLREAGWDPGAKAVAEFPVEGMPKKTAKSTGKGRVDYVLWDDNGLPLALVEAKRTKYDPLKGQHQAKLYAECLAKQFGWRPVIFCSNGYEHWIWDDVRYPPREVHGFYTKSELQLLHHRRSFAKRLSVIQPNREIAGRAYQIEAIRRITETFTKKGRKALLVMATGTGKTRTAIALVDVLKKADWVKRVLFLADRNALLTQAKRAFTTHLPSAQAIDITQHKDGTDATVVLSTYPTMLNRIDRKENGRATFGPGHFDLIIVDEAHRSIYQKYAALFDYFDGLLVGLTATPRDEVHRDTYRVFDLEPGVPTHAYELDEAIADGHLVPPRGVTVPFKFLQQGITYAKLSEAAKAEYEAKHRRAAAARERRRHEPVAVQHRDRRPGHRARDDPRPEGRRRRQAGQDHRLGEFAQIIDSHSDYAQSLLDDFSQPDKAPQIALSVDMLDTGVDVPECVNLVFFKPIRSRVKFNQMIGRGTRLCPDLFGEAGDKTEFLVFDLCSNFEFFGQDLAASDPKLGDTLTARLVKARLGLAQRVPAQDEDLAPLRTSLLDHLHEHVATMNDENFLVRKHRRVVEEFSERGRWEALSAEDADVFADELAPLPNGLEPEGPEPKQFDVLLYRLMISQLQGSKRFGGYRDKVKDLAERLAEVANVPMVAKEMVLIEALQGEEYWQDITLPMLDEVRVRLRELVQFIERGKRPNITIDLPDPLDDDDLRVADVPIRQTGFSPGQYRKKVERIVRDNTDHIAIAKLHRGKPVTAADLRALEAMLFDPETTPRDRFDDVFGSQSLQLFVRRLIGLDRAAVQGAFAAYIAESGFTADQIRFVSQIVDFLTTNGVMDPGLLYEAPFTDSHRAGLDGVFDDDDADRIVAIVRGFNETVGVQFTAS